MQTTKRVQAYTAPGLTSTVRAELRTCPTRNLNDDNKVLYYVRKSTAFGDSVQEQLCFFISEPRSCIRH